MLPEANSGLKDRFQGFPCSFEVIKCILFRSDLLDIEEVIVPTSNSDDPPSPSLSTRQSITYRSAPKVLLAGAVLTTLTILGLWIFALSPPDRRICPTDYQPYVGTQFDSSSITRINGPIQKFQYWMQSRLIVGPDKVPEMCFIPYRGIHATALRPPGPLQVNPDAILLSDQHDIRELNETYQYTVINLLLGIFFGTSLLLTMRLWQRRLELTE